MGFGAISSVSRTKVTGFRSISCVSEIRIMCFDTFRVFKGLG